MQHNSWQSRIRFYRRALAMTAIIVMTVMAVMTGCSKKEPTSYQGYVEGEFVYVSSAEAGRLDRLLVARGQKVSARTPLFALESINETAAQRQAQQQLSAAEAQLQDLRSGKRPQELDVIRAQLAQAVAKEKTSSAQLVRDQAQYKIGGISQAHLDQSRAEAEANSERVRELRSQLTVADLPAREEQIKAQTASVAAARAALDQAAWKLTQKAVTASGPALVFDTLYREGEWVKAGNPVVRLLPPQNVKVRFFVPETALGALSIGRAVALHCDGCPADVPAKVTYIATEAEYTPPIIYSNETRSKLVFMVEAHPDAGAAHNLHPGQPVEVKPR
ncbi:MAG: secretion protein HlyD [Geobacteraceae bacterium GWC2_58_44]|nr:MAG: secretion protein HlyD [Geobacteraceae bacterium GWC2_58_44]